MKKEELDIIYEWFEYCKQNPEPECTYKPCSNCEKIMRKLNEENLQE